MSFDPSEPSTSGVTSTRSSRKCRREKPGSTVQARWFGARSRSFPAERRWSPSKKRLARSNTCVLRSVTAALRSRSNGRTWHGRLEVDRARLFHRRLRCPAIISVQRRLVHLSECLLLVRCGTYVSCQHLLQSRKHGMEKPGLNDAGPYQRCPRPSYAL